MRTFDVVVVGGGPNVAAMLARRDEVIGVDEHTGEPDEAVVLSGGSEPLLPPIDGLEDVDGVWTDREALTTREIPRRMIIVGAGAVGLELAQAFQKLGSQVTLIEGEPRVLPNHEEFARFQLTTALGQDGVEILTGRRVVLLGRNGDARPSRARRPRADVRISTGYGCISGHSALVAGRTYAART